MLWGRRGANNTLRIDQQKLAGELHVTRHTLNRVLARMIVEGRMLPAKGARRGKTQTYVIADPATWAPAEPEGASP